MDEASSTPFHDPVSPRSVLSGRRAAESDEELIECALEGNRDAYGELVKRYTPFVLGYLRAKYPGTSEIEDVIQEVFCRAYVQLGRLRNRNRFGSWLLTIARNEMLDTLARASAQAQGKSRADDAVGAGSRGMAADPMASASLEETQGKVIEAIGGLTVTYQAILYMRIIDEEPLNEIAHRLGLKQSTVRMRLLRGLKKLRTQLKKQGITR